MPTNFENRLAEMDINPLDLQQLPHVHRYSINKLLHGQNVTIATAEAIADHLAVTFGDLFTTIPAKNHQDYACLVDVEKLDIQTSIWQRKTYEPYNWEDETTEDTKTTDPKTTDKAKQKATNHPRITQSRCIECGSATTRFREINGRLMCLRCADIARCSQCHRPAHLLYLVDGAMTCPHCEAKTRQAVMENVPMAHKEKSK